MTSRSIFILGMLFATNVYSLSPVQAASMQHNQSDKILIAKDERRENNQDRKDRDLKQPKPLPQDRTREEEIKRKKKIEEGMRRCRWWRSCGPTNGGNEEIEGDNRPCTWWRPCGHGPTISPNEKSDKSITSP